MFLSVTAIEEFWEKDEQILFLGEWCKLFKRKKEWEKLDYQTLEFIWNDTQKTSEAIEYCNLIYQESLTKICNELNEYHKINKDEKFYNIILGNWLYNFIHQLYDKYLTLKKAFETNPNLKSILLDKSQYYIPFSYTDYSDEICNDKYCLQMYSELIKELGFSFKTQKLQNPLNKKNTYQTESESLKKKIVFGLFAFISKSIYKKNTITITSPYFSYSPILSHIKVLFSSKLRCIFDNMKYDFRVLFGEDKKFRKKK